MNNYYPQTAYLSRAFGPHSYGYKPCHNNAHAPGAAQGERLGRLVGAAIYETVMLPKKLVFGTGQDIRCSARMALRPNALSLRERGIVGCVAFAAGKLLQFAGAGAGALAGAMACAVGALVGCRSDDWIDLGAGKGWQVGTMAATCVMTVTDRLGVVLTPVSAVLWIATVGALELAGSLAGQAVDLVRSAPGCSAAV